MSQTPLIRTACGVNVTTPDGQSYSLAKADRTATATPATMHTAIAELSACPIPEDCAIHAMTDLEARLEEVALHG